MKKPKAVLISDVHFNQSTLSLASQAVYLALDKADELKVPMIVAGDLHDTKANLRGECVNAMLNIFSAARAYEPLILIGNHDKINEKSEEHALNFLKNCCTLIEKPAYNKELDFYFIPYQHDITALRSWLKNVPRKGATLIMHQGVKDAKSGEYFLDHTALSTEDLADFRVISGHYHTRQDIKCGQTGLFSYIGNPYTLTYTEAEDPEKGFQVLYDDGSLEFVPTQLRKHLVYKLNFEDLQKPFKFTAKSGDLPWIKITGCKEDLSTLTRRKVAEALKIPTNGWKLDFYYSPDNDIGTPLTRKPYSISIDDTIENLQNTSTAQKSRLKGLWKTLVGG